MAIGVAWLWASLEPVRLPGLKRRGREEAPPRTGDCRLSTDDHADAVEVLYSLTRDAEALRNQQRSFEHFMAAVASQPPAG